MKKPAIILALMLTAAADEGGYKPSPPFSVRKEDSGWWLVSPEGQKFFSMGVCCVNQGVAKKDYDPENPSYAAWHYYPTTLEWADSTLRRMKSWKFTTVGGWSDYDILRQSPEETLWLTPVLHIGSTAGAPWWDMWDPRNIRRMENIARDQIIPLKDDPRVLGYYSDNELGWWNATLWKMTLEHPSSSEQRRRLIRLLREIYRDDWKELMKDFDPENASSWRQLQRGGMLYLKSGGRGIHTMRRFLGMIADRYYELMRDTIRKFDRRALYLGDRYQSFYYPEVARASARFVDVSSSNLNAFWNDGTYLRCYLDTLHALTGKPILISEFYLAAKDNRSGNRNTRGGYPIVTTQRERGDAARNTLDALARLPYVLGADWFQYSDEPQKGRPDGENFNFGLVDIYNQPYEDVTAMFASFDGTAAKSRTLPPRPDVSSGVPTAPPDPFGNFVGASALQQWDRERGFVKPASEFPLGDLYVCWSGKALYLGLIAFDIVEAAYYRDSSVPKIDRALWTVKIGGRKIVHARVGSGREPLISDPRVRVENLSGVDLAVRNVAAMELPAELLGKDALKAGDSIELECSLDTHCAAYRIEWKGTFVLSEQQR
jgi:hypothetical protein